MLKLVLLYAQIGLDKPVMRISSLLVVGSSRDHYPMGDSCILQNIVLLVEVQEMLLSITSEVLLETQDPELLGYLLRKTQGYFLSFL